MFAKKESQTVIDGIEYDAEETPDTEADGHIAKIMDTEVETCERGGGCPEEEDEGHACATEEP